MSNGLLQLELWCDSVDRSLHRSVASLDRSLNRLLARSMARSIARPNYFGGSNLKFRIIDILDNYLEGPNFELLACIFISSVSEFQIALQKKYDRTFSLFQGVPVAEE